MANLTKAQRHNKMLEDTFNTYRSQQEKLPPCHLYGRFLEIAEETLHITKDEARAKYGQYTVQQWETLLKLGWNKNLAPIITKQNKNYILVTSRWEDFTKFCSRVKNELGETLFTTLNPIQEGNKFYVHIPFENKNRLTEAVCNYSGTELHPSIFTYFN